MMVSFISSVISIGGTANMQLSACLYNKFPSCAVRALDARDVIMI